MLEQLFELLKGNQFASGGLLVLLSGAGLGVLYRLQGYLFRFIKYWFFTEINFTSEDNSFLAIQHWLFNQEYTKKRCSNLMVKNIFKSRRSRQLYEIGEGQIEDNISQIFVPGYGTHYFLMGWRPAILTYTKSDTKDLRYQEFISLRIFNFKNKFEFVEKLVKESTDIFDKTSYRETQIYGCIDRYSNWSLLLKKNIRQKPILSTPLEYDKIVKEITSFINNKDWYNERGINYKKGLLFAGIPGSGKTSCVLSLAQHFKRNIYSLNLNDVNNIDDSKFIDLISSLPKDSILLIEDIDAISVEKRFNNSNEEDEKRAVSLTTVLNSLDGLLTPDGLIFFITTNHPEKLDPALIRPGRIDVIQKFDYANEYQVESLYKRFFPDSIKDQEFINTFIGKPMSAVESELISRVI